ncbi:MAG: hypothetical protein AAFQ02_01800 [Bacteroidota bacterium]
MEISTTRINLISGPRNMSTAFMYSWASRSDTQVVDEPWFGYYLAKTGIIYHPGTDQVLKSMPTTWDAVLEQSIFCTIEVPVYFIKGMAHHLIHNDLRCLLELKNLFLIRDPAKLIASFAKVIDEPSMADIGLRREWELYSWLCTEGRNPTVIDSDTIRKDPPAALRKICSLMEIPFSGEMLRWEAGPKPYDGVWAKYWYHSAWKSTGYAPYIGRDIDVHKRHRNLYEEALPYYRLLKQQAVQL